MRPTVTPILLVVLDGWGYSENTEFNAIHSAHSPVWDELWRRHPHTLLQASGTSVGLPENQMGNSEVGHMNMGAGRVVGQEFTRISRAIQDGSFFRNETLRRAFAHVAANGKAVHLLGLLSPGGVHGHEEHIFAMMELIARCGQPRAYLHAFLDGRDTPPKSAAESIRRAVLKAEELGTGRIASMIGRYYAMDRNRNWKRTRQAHELIAHGRARHRCEDPLIALDQAYRAGQSDEFLKPTAVLHQGKPVRLEEGDMIVFMNYRADRARQLSRSLTNPDFSGFERGTVPKLSAFISLTEYHAKYEFPVAFPPEALTNVFGQYISDLGLRQLRIAETEKYAHVTFFFNGGEERAFEGEHRILVPSAHVATYDRKPEMSARQITDKLVRAIKGKEYHAIICNYANADMVGHSGDLGATVKAVEAIDACLRRLLAACRNGGCEMIVTADHGNAEQLKSYITEKVQAQPHTAHTSNPVPFVYVGRPGEVVSADGRLSDVTPTMLYLMGLNPPREMTGKPLIRLQEASQPSAKASAQG
ncbi:MAG: 2,3-bisphosphoglycerate-independent phosphoglycerate mutase [Gammaproteobacteria bacterium]|nr:2,3-bisphosphoglycerate-independent phosphoglycerate mutase [Gammaproteobacteria bacterium]